MAKKKIIAVAITADRGLEVAEMDYAAGTILKYAHRDLDVVTLKSVIPDMDVFKELLSECLLEIGAPKGSSIVISLPTVAMGIGNYMTSQSDESIVQLVSNDLVEKDLVFRDDDPLVVTTGLSVTIQSKVVAYTAAVYSVIQEVSRIIVDLGYKIQAIDVSVASVLRALLHSGKAQAQQDATWLMLLVDNHAARLLALNGTNLVEYKEEQLVYDYADTASNCDMVASTMASYIEKLPAKYLFVVSRTDAVSAEMLSAKIKYNNPIIFLEANGFSKEEFIEAPDLEPSEVKHISLDIIGACLYDEGSLHFNLFCDELGDVYWSQQPPQFKLNGKTIVVTNELLTKWCIILLLLILVPVGFAYVYFNNEYNTISADYEAAKDKLKKTEEQITKYEGLVSTEVFSEQDEVRIGLVKNTAFYNYIDLLGRDTPSKLWLTSVIIDNYVKIEGRSGNIESIYTFFRNIKDSISETNVKLQKLSLATAESADLPSDLELLKDEDLPENTDNAGALGEFTENSNDIILSSNADFYEFVISDKTPKELEEMLDKALNAKNKKAKKK